MSQQQVPWHIKTFAKELEEEFGLKILETATTTGRKVQDLSLHDCGFTQQSDRERLVKFLEGRWSIDVEPRTRNLIFAYPNTKLRNVHQACVRAETTRPEPDADTPCATAH